MADETIIFNADAAFIRDVADAGFGLKLPRLTRGAAPPILISVVLTVLALIRDSHTLWLILVAAPAVLGIVTLVASWFVRGRLRRSVAKGFAALPPPATVTLTLSDTGIRFANAAGVHDVPWDQLASIDEGERVWFLKVGDSGATSVPVPAAAISSEAVTCLRARRGPSGT